ncbi:MAG TPA: hypothetical protein PLV25_05955, partial [Opitutales bacterium]|nr:hypothetical protein [Opitutales bacterium]
MNTPIKSTDSSAISAASANTPPAELANKAVSLGDSNQSPTPTANEELTAHSASSASSTSTSLSDRNLAAELSPEEAAHLLQMAAGNPQASYNPAYLGAMIRNAGLRALQNLVNEHGQNLLDIAQVSSNKPMANQLVQAGLTSSQSTDAMTLHNNTSNANEAGENVDFTDSVLPHELIQHILNHLTVQEAARAGQTNKAMLAATRELNYIRE